MLTYNISSHYRGNPEDHIRDVTDFRAFPTPLPSHTPPAAEFTSAVDLAQGSV